MKYKGIIFDFNGVILWDEEWHKEAWKEAGKELIGRYPTEEEFLEMWGRTNAGVFELLSGRKPDEAELKYLVDVKEKMYRDIAIKQKDFHLSPGSVELFNLLKNSNIPFTIATSSEVNNTKFFFENLPLNNWFSMEKIVFDNGAFAGKPAPDIYIKAEKLIGIEPKECIVVEDAKSGITAAYAAGIGKIIALNSRVNEEILKTLPGVKRVIQRLDEITLEDFE
jgi:beta-phosphoglucomutase-like phosphatase (HAD superfamily)